MEKVGAAIKKIIHYQTIRGKFSSVHLAAEGITRVEVGEEGLHFISDQQTGELPFDSRCFNKQSLTFDFTDSGNQESSMCLPAAMDEDDDETLKRAIAMSLQEDPPTIKVEDSEEEMLAKAMAMSLEEHPKNKEENISETEEEK